MKGFDDGPCRRRRCGLFSCSAAGPRGLGLWPEGLAGRVLRAAAVLLLLAFMVAGCSDETAPPVIPPPPPDEEPEWTSLGFHSHWANELELSWPHLYACAADEGLFRANVESEDVQWEYVGLADTSISKVRFGHYFGLGVQDVVVLEGGVLLAALHSGLWFFPGVWISKDGGKSWERSDEGIADPDNEFAGTMTNLERSPCEEGTVYAIGYATYRSRDNGSTWELIWGEPEGGILYYDFEISPSDCEVMWQGGESAIFQPELEKSTDGGSTWEIIPLGRVVVPSDNAVYDVAIDPFDPQVVYLGTQGAVIKTVDGGETWISPLFTSRSGQPVWALALDDKRQGHLFAGAGMYMYESWDGGETVEELESPIAAPILDFEYDSERRMLYVGTLGGVYRYYSP